ncbi:MAG: response regulator, partial [Bacteroidales bacterium]|nr:response regulator [Bacteroidales bacterium]
MRKSLTHILKSDRSIEVVDCGVNGEEAIEKVRQLHPDVVLLDIEMPVMDGLTALSYIMAECPTPVLMLSGLNKTDATIAIRSLDYGAVDFIPKPSGVISYDIEKLSSEIISKVKTAANINVHKLKLNIPKDSLTYQLPGSVPQKKIIVIGASTGGPRAVSEVLSGLLRDISTAIIIVQHMNQEFIPSIVERLNYGCSLNISIAKNNEVITPGKVVIAPEGCDLDIKKCGEAMKICLTADS